MSKLIGIIDWHEEANSRPKTLIPQWAADLLVQRCAAEKISARIIRRFAPDSVFFARRPLPDSPRFIPTKLPPAEVENCKFVPPLSLPRPSMAAIRAGWDWSTDQIAI